MVVIHDRQRRERALFLCQELIVQVNWFNKKWQLYRNCTKKSHKPCNGSLYGYTIAAKAEIAVAKVATQYSKKIDSKDDACRSDSRLFHFI